MTLQEPKRHRLDFQADGSVALSPLDLIDRDERTLGYQFTVLSGEGGFGDPAPVEVVLASLLLDGESVVTQRHSNREVGFVVQVDGVDAEALATAERLLHERTGKPGALSWTSPYGGPVSVFDVVTSSLEFRFDDQDEVRLRRRYRLRMVCLPFARPAEPVVVGAEVISGTVTTVDECDSTTGWTALASPGGSIASGNPPTIALDTTAANRISGTGSIKVTPNTVIIRYEGKDSYANVSKTLSVSGATYLVAHVKTSWTLISLKAYITTASGGRQLVSTVVAEGVANGFIKYAWRIPDTSTVTALELQVFQQRSGDQSPGADPFWVDLIGTSAATSTSGQQARILEIEGSARTSGSLAVSSTVGLGEVLLYTTPDRGDGFRPDLRRWQVSGTSNTSTAGALNSTMLNLNLSDGVFDAPARSFRPGAYSVLARIQSFGGVGTGYTLSVSAQLRSGLNQVGPVEVAQQPGTTFLAAEATWQIVEVGTLNLPPTQVDPASSASVRFTVDGGVLYLDEVWVFPKDEAALTWLAVGSGTPSQTISNRVWVDAPRIGDSDGEVYRGTATDRSDARSAAPDVLCPGLHQLYPGRNLAFLVTTGAAGAALTGTYYPRFHTNVTRTS